MVQTGHVTEKYWTRTTTRMIPGWGGLSLLREAEGCAFTLKTHDAHHCPLHWLLLPILHITEWPSNATAALAVLTTTALCSLRVSLENLQLDSEDTSTLIFQTNELFLLCIPYFREW